MWNRLLFFGWMLVLVAPAWAQNAIEQDPGYVNLDEIEGWFAKEPKIVVNVKGALLNLVAEASRYEDPDLADLLHKLKAIQVRGFDLRWSDFEDVQRRATALSQRLESRGWDTVVRVRDEDEYVDIHVRVNDNVIAGMVVMVVSPDEDETVFVNIVGQIDPEQIGRLGRKFDIEPLNDMTLKDY